MNALAVPLSLVAAGSFAVSSVLQQADARDRPAAETMSWRLIVDLVHRRNWLIGMGCVLVGFALQAMALSLAPVAVVEPLIATELVLALPLASRLRKRRLGRRERLGAAGVSAGVALFLAVSSPRGGDPEPGIAAWLLVGLPVIVVALSAIAFAGERETPRRAALLALAAGLCFALLALVLQSLVTVIARSPLLAVESWQPYLLVVLGPVAFTIAQSAYQSAPLAISLPIIDSIEPTGAVILSVLAFRQNLALAPSSLALESLGGLIALSGILLLGRSPLVLSIYARQQAEKNFAQLRAPTAPARS